jgi:outer membrane lipoprotein SlyB
MTRSLLRFALLASGLALPGLTACAPGLPTNQVATLLSHPTSTTPTGTTPTGTTNDGTILSMRTVAAPSQPAGGTGGAMSAMNNPMAAGLGGGASGGTGGLSSMLVAGLGGGGMGNMTSLIGAAPATPAQAAATHGQAVEFTLRMDDGSTQTVVQGDAQGLHAGDRVEVVRGDRTHVVRAG